MFRHPHKLSEHSELLRNISNNNVTVSTGHSVGTHFIGGRKALLDPVLDGAVVLRW